VSAGVVGRYGPASRPVRAVCGTRRVGCNARRHQQHVWSQRQNETLRQRLSNSLQAHTWSVSNNHSFTMNTNYQYNSSIVHWSVAAVVCSWACYGIFRFFAHHPSPPSLMCTTDWPLLEVLLVIVSKDYPVQRGWDGAQLFQFFGARTATDTDGPIYCNCRPVVFLLKLSRGLMPYVCQAVWPV